MTRKFDQLASLREQYQFASKQPASVTALIIVNAVFEHFFEEKKEAEDQNKKKRKCQHPTINLTKTCDFVSSICHSC